MPIPSGFPEAWGRTKVALLEQHEDKEWFCSDWYDLVDAPAHEKLHHGSLGSIPADTILVALRDEVIAIGEAFNIEPINLYAWDNEYYLVLRIREVKEPTLWKTLPWSRFGAGNVVHVWDKFHGIEYFRGQHDPTRSLSYGGDWSHLEHLLAAEHPPAIPASYTDPPGSDHCCPPSATTIFRA